MQVIRKQRVPGQTLPPLRGPHHAAELGARLGFGRRTLLGVSGVVLLTLTLSLAAPLTAQVRAVARVQARVLAVGPSREALTAGLGAAKVGQVAARSSLATVRISPSPAAEVIAADRFRRRPRTLVRIDFLRN